jgi:hypothetical protein
MLGISDCDGVTQKGYEAICKAVKHRVWLVAPELKGSLLPSGNRLVQLRKQMNAQNRALNPKIQGDDERYFSV